MTRNRVEAFSDGVLAIIITVMVIELKIPESPSFTALFHEWPSFLSYLISFVYIGIFWNNHHHLFHTVKEVNGAVLWANNHLLFWLSLVPFTTNWSGENHFASVPVFFYSFVLVMAALAYYILTVVIIGNQKNEPILKNAVNRKVKEILSIVGYLASMVLSFFVPVVSVSLIALVGVSWLIPDRRIEKVLEKSEATSVES